MRSKDYVTTVLLSQLRALRRQGSGGVFCFHPILGLRKLGDVATSIPLPLCGPIEHSGGDRFVLMFGILSRQPLPSYFDCSPICGPRQGKLYVACLIPPNTLVPRGGQVVVATFILPHFGEGQECHRYVATLLPPHIGKHQKVAGM